MKIGVRDYPTAFILGAGASRGALRHVIVNHKRIRPPLNGDFFHIADTYTRANRHNSADADRLMRIHHIIKNELSVKGEPTMEEAFSLLYVAKEFHDIYRVKGRRPPPGVRREIEDFLLLVFHILGALDYETPIPNGYDRLVSRLGSKDTIITLNYDTLCDSALMRAGWNPKRGYCLGITTSKIRWGSSVRLQSDLSTIPLLKLHGSLNWFVSGSFKDVSAVFEKKPVCITSPRMNEISGTIRQIVPPIYGKFFRHDHWRQLWSHAYSALRDAEIIVVIGCSLVDSDFHLRALLSRVVKQRKMSNKPYRQAFYVDNSLKVRRKWQQVFKGAVRQTKSVKGFQKFLTQELKT